MRNIFSRSFLLPLICLLAVSCQKEISWDGPISGGGGATPNKLLGDWKFISLGLKSEIVEELSDGQDLIKTITAADYTSTNNTGDVKIEAATMTSTNLSYDVSTVVIVDFYDNGILFQTDQQTWDFSAPASSTSKAYQLIGADSLYFPNGGFVTATDFQGGGGQPVPTGYHYTLNGNTLTLTMPVHTLQQQTSSGITQKVATNATGTVILQK